ncbi:MAG: MATE family efflux transporter [Parvibaculales bacterium]
MSDTVDAMRSGTLLEDTKSLLQLAWPIILNRAGIFSLSVVDTIMVGQYASTQLAYLSVGQVPVGFCLLLSIGLLIGTMVLSANHYGAGEYEQCGAVWWRSLPFAMVIGFVGMGVCLFGEPLLSLFGQPLEIAENAGRISMIFGLGLPLAMLSITTGFFLESIGRVKPGMIIILIANVLNFFLNSIFINGGMGLEAMGAEGSAWSTLIVRTVQCTLIVGYVWMMADWKKFGMRTPPSLAWRHAKRQREIGYASGLSMGIENMGFNALVLFAGIIGTTAVAGFSITFNLFSLCFMIGLGVGTASSVLVGNAYGAGQMQLVARYGWIGLGVQFCLMFVIAVLIYANAELLVSTYTRDVEVAVMAAMLLQYAMLAILFDAAQALLVQVLRARQDIWMAMLIQLASFGILMIPASYLATFVIGRGVIGLIDGLVAGAALAFILAFARFSHLVRADENKNAQAKLC